MSSNNTEKKLYDLLTTKNFDNFEVFDSKTSKPPIDPRTGQEDVSRANMYKFDWTSRTGHNYGTAVILLNNDGDLEIYFGDNLGRSMESEDKSEWYDFLHQLKNFATKNFKGFSPKNLNQLRYTMQGQAAIKEGLFESWSGTRTTSWNGKQTEARLMIRHKKTLGENDARFRYIESLFLETAEGERYKLPFTKLAGGRAMLEHVRQGGKPYDLRGQHITEMVNELNVLSRFRRANHGKVFEGDTAQLVEQTDAYYESAQKTLKHLSTSRGYTNYFESWTPAEVTEEEVVIEGLKHLFVKQSIDQRIEEALPILARIQQQENTMKEADIFESWASRLMEGTWALPDTKEQQAKLVELLSKPLTVGPDATNATEQLYDLLGDDELFDQLEELAEKDPNADCRQIIMDRMSMLSDHPEVRAVIDQVQIDDTAEMNPPAGTDAGMSADPESAQIPTNEEDLEDVDTIVNDPSGNLLQDIEIDQRKTDESVKDPAIQTEDPPNTQQPEYDEYQDDLATILKHAGVDDTVIAAPDYEAEVDEGIGGGIAGGLGGAAIGGALGGLPGAVIGGLLGGAAGDDITDESEETDEGWKGQLAGGVLGTLAGGALGGPIGAAIGGTAGQMAGDKLGGKEETDEGQVHSVPTYIGKLGAAAVKAGADDAVEIGKTLVGKDEDETNEDLDADGVMMTRPTNCSSESAEPKGNPLQGKYGHSGKLDPIGESPEFLTRLKELAGMIRN